MSAKVTLFLLSLSYLGSWSTFRSNLGPGLGWRTRSCVRQPQGDLGIYTEVWTIFVASPVTFPCTPNTDGRFSIAAFQFVVWWPCVGDSLQDSGEKVRHEASTSNYEYDSK